MLASGLKIGIRTLFRDIGDLALIRKGELGTLKKAQKKSKEG